MRIGLVTDSLGHLPFDELLGTAAELGIKALEYGCGGWSSAPHLNLDLLVENEIERKNFVAKIRDHGLEISALNCSGNQLAPGERGKFSGRMVRKTMKLAQAIGARRIVMMSACLAALATRMRTGSQRPSRPNVMKSCDISGRM